MSTITKEQAQKIIEAADEVITALAGTNEDVHPESDSMLRLWDDLNDRYAPPEVVRELARIALASLEAEPVAYSLIFRNIDGVLNDYVNANTTFSTIEKAQAYGRGGDYVRQNDGSLQWVSDPSLDPVVVPLFTAPPAPVSVPDNVSGPLAHAYKELTPTFMRNHIDVFERYGIYPDGSAGIQAMRIALDGMNRRAAMLQGAEPVTTAYKLPEPIKDNRLNSGVEADDYYSGYQAGWNELLEAVSDNSPVIPDGWVLVPVDLTCEMDDAAWEAYHDTRCMSDIWAALLEAASQQEVK